MKTIIAVLILLISAGLCGAQEKLEDTLRKGIVEEETNNNLDGALRAYQSVIAQYDGDRAIAATALFRIAETYRKMGKTAEANAAYGRLVRDFPEQARLVALSKAQLPQAPSGPESAELEALMRKLNEIGQQAALQDKMLAEAHKQYELGAIDAQILQERELAYHEYGVKLADAQREIAKLKKELSSQDQSFMAPGDALNVLMKQAAELQAVIAATKQKLVEARNGQASIERMLGLGKQLQDKVTALSEVTKKIESLKAGLAR